MLTITNLYDSITLAQAGLEWSYTLATNGLTGRTEVEALVRYLVQRSGEVDLLLWRDDAFRPLGVSFTDFCAS